MPLPKAASLALPVFLLLAPAASALTAEELWAEAQRLTMEAGTTVTATARRQGDRLVLTDLVLAMGSPYDPVDLKLERITLQDRPDGSVAVLLPPTFPVTFNLGKAEPERGFVTLSTSAPGFSLVVADIGPRAAFDLQAPSLTVSLEKFVPAPKPGEKVDFTFAVADLSLQHRMDLTASSQVATMSLQFGTLHSDLNVDVDGASDGAMSVDLSDVSVSLNALVPSSLDDIDARVDLEGENFLPYLLDVLSDGLTFKAGATHGPLAMMINVNDADRPKLVEVTSQLGRLNVGLDAAGISYDAVFGKTVTTIRGDFPEEEFQDFAMEVDEVAYGLRIGIGDLVTPQDVALTTRVTNLSLSPEVWAEIEPTGVLGSSPLSYGFDIAMRYALKPQMLDPKWQLEPDTFPPVDIVDLTLNALNLEGFGVNLGGSGAITFDESDLVTFPGFPVPEGKMSFTATGVNSLIDRLAAGGLIPLDEVTGLRMGLMFIAKVGKAPDSLVSELEFRAKSFYLNGLKIR
ncbi:hypothetical protein MCELHM10_00044 [Paracoccaceae bacterium]|jgi:hypothetical protein